MQIRRGGIGLLTAAVLSFVLAATSFAQETGGITGTVTDSVTGLPMAGAKVSVDGTPLNVQTDRQGKFTLVAVPSGEISITITYLGYADKTVTTNVSRDAFSSVSVELESSVREVVEVSAPILEGQAKALNQQKEAVNITNVVSSDQIGRFPDPNSAEATQRIPGITIERDQGEGRYVSVRGTEPRLNAMMIDGERIPSPEGDIRAVALDVVPADLLEAIEVTKAPTADMWADSIGGSVNLVTKGAPSKTKVSLTAGWGYNRISEDDLQTFNGTVGSRFFNDKLGALFSASYFNTDRGSENFEVEYDDGDLDSLELRDYSINRKRWGFVPAFDYAFSPTSSIYFKGIYNQFDDYEYRRAIAYKVSDGEIERELKDRFEGQTIYQAKVGGDHLLPNFIRLDWGASVAFSDEEEPDAAYSNFLQEDVVFDPNVSPGSINPDNIQANPLNEDFNEYFFDGASNENNVTTDRDVAFRFNVSMPLPTSSGFAGVFKFGAADRYKKKFRNVQVREFEFDDDDDAPVFVNVLDSSFDTTTIIDGRYNFGAIFQDPAAARAILTSPNAESEFDLEEDAADYRASENVFAAYAMTQLNIGEKFVLVPGIRFERTDIDYVGNEVLFDDEGDYVSTLAIPGENSFNNYFASVHAKYRFTDKTNFRASFAQTLARPNYFDLAPYQLILEEDLEIERGNPFLEPTKANNFDVMIEHYFGSIGIVSGGFFYKRLKDFIFPFTYEEERQIGLADEGKGPIFDTFDVIQPLNGETADLYGFEVAFQNQFTFLPKPFDGLGVYANYTYVNSEATLPGGRTADLPGQAQNVANVSVSYERFGFSGRLSLHYRDLYLSEVSDDPLEDIFVDGHSQLDFTMSQRITKNVRVFAEFLNLTNEPFRAYQGIATRPVQEEYYRWWATFGIKLDW